MKETGTTMETPTDRRSPRRDWACILGTGAAALLAAGILGSSASAGAAASNAPIGAVGSVAALSGSSMEVQNPSTGQTTVSWTATTTFSKSVTESVSAVSVGDCVTATGSTSKKSKTTIAAHSVTLTTPRSDGTCAPSAGGPFRIGAGSGGPPAGGFRFRTGSGGASNKFPEGGSGPRTLPGGGAANNFRKQLANLDIASGKVTAVNGSTLTVSGISLSPGSFAGRGKSNSKTKAPAKPKTQTLKVTTTSSTPVNTSQSVTSGDLAVGDCVSAFGPAATNGSVTATTVRITSTGGGDCTGGFPGGGGFFGRGGGSA
jgi:hypothetical protein